MRNLNKTISFCLLFLLIAVTARSQFYRVYEYTTLDPSEKELVFWTSYIASSDNTHSFFGDEISRKGLFAHSIEFEYGLSPVWTVAFYMDFEQPAGESLKWVRTKAVMFHYALFEKGQLPVDLALYGEYKLPRKDYDVGEELEFKLIMEKDFGSHRFVLNPTFEKKISGPDVEEGVEFALNGVYTFVRSLRFQPRIEYYSKMGELSEMDIYGDQNNYIFPSFDLFLGRYYQFRWHAGVGFGLTDPADNIIIKSIFSWEFF